MGIWGIHENPWETAFHHFSGLSTQSVFAHQGVRQTSEPVCSEVGPEVLRCVSALTEARMREWHNDPSAKPEGMSMPPETQELCGSQPSKVAFNTLSNQIHLACQALQGDS